MIDACDRRDDQHASVEAIDVGLGLQAEQAKRLFISSDSRLRLGQIALRLLERDSRRGLMVEQILGHRGGLLRQLEILVAFGVFAYGCGRVAAADGAQHLAFVHDVADLRPQVDDLAGERRQHVREPVFIELHLAGNRQRPRNRMLTDGLDGDGAQGDRIHGQVGRSSRGGGRSVAGRRVR